MKYPQSPEPSWHVWSDGRPLSPSEAKGARKAWRQCRLRGESPRHFFERMRPAFETALRARLN